MSIRAEVKLKSRKNDFIQKPEVFSIGGFEFLIGSKVIRFDFNESNLLIEFDEDGFLNVSSELRYFDEITFSEEWMDQKLSISDVKAFLLTEPVEKIIEAFYEAFFSQNVEKENDIFLDLVSFVLFNPDGDEVNSLSEKVIKQFNKEEIEKNCKGDLLWELEKLVAKENQGLVLTSEEKNKYVKLHELLVSCNVDIPFGVII